MRELYQKNRLFFLLLIAAGTGFLVWYFSEIVIFIIIAGIVSIIGTPLVDFLDKIRIGKIKFPHGLSVSITLIVLLAFFFGLLSLFIPLVMNEAELIAGIDGKKLAEYYEQDIRQFQSMMIRFGVMPKGATIESTIKNSILKIIDFGMFSNLLASVISFTGNFFFNLFSIVFLSFFFLKDNRILPRFILLITPEKYDEQIRIVMSKSRDLLSRYFIGLALQILANIVTYSLALYIAGVKSALVIGFFAGIIIIIPYLGGIISMMIGVILGVTGVIAMGDYAQIMPAVIKILVVMFIVQTIDNNIFAPIIQGKSVKAHPVEIFLVVIAAAGIGGIIGMVVAVPAYGFIKIVAGEFLNNFRIVRKLAEKS